MTNEGPPAGYEYYSKFPEGFPGAGLFNLHTMADEHIALLGRALDREHERMCQEGRYAPEQENTIADLLGHLGSDLAQLAVTNPERGKPLLMRLAQSDDPYERSAAIASGVPLCLRDYETACEVILTAQDKIKNVGGDYNDIVGTLLHMSAVLPLELSADFDQRCYERWPDGA